MPARRIAGRAMPPTHPARATTAAGDREVVFPARRSAATRAHVPGGGPPRIRCPPAPGTTPAA